jgi:carbonic anhydrase/acetyltransferase-like protein (isoleucine patch superfamily)
VIGHLVHLEGCVIEDGALVGSGSVVLHRARVGSGATVGAGAVVTNGMQVPPGALAVGTPAIIKEGRSNPAFIKDAMNVYVENTERYRRGLRRLD